MNVHEYISFVRMENAKYMLKNTDLPIKSIVENIGYIDVSSFGRKFYDAFKPLFIQILGKQKTVYFVTEYPEEV